jgi:hypothetical protein
MPKSRGGATSEGMFVLPPPSHEGPLPYDPGVSLNLTPYPLETLSIHTSPVFLSGYRSELGPLQKAMGIASACSLSLPHQHPSKYSASQKYQPYIQVTLRTVPARPCRFSA